MSLVTYHKKRHFNRTPEPKGRETERKKGTLLYVIQKHDATRLHYDFRLQWDGVLKSWAVPKGPSLDPARKALAVHVEDHPIDYGDFEGVIPKGEYGGGTVLLWDRGTWEPIGDAEEELRRGRLHFILNGEKLRGEWAIVQMHGSAGGDGKNWLLMKIKDKYASTTRDILAAAPKSVKSKRSLEAIAGDRDAVWSGEAKETAKLPQAEKAKFPGRISPQLAVLADKPPTGDNWIHEIKFDGYRLLAYVKSGEVVLYTRNGLDWTDKFRGVASALKKLKADSAILDGEAVVLDEKGRSDFQALQASLKEGSGSPPVYYAFDLLFLDGVDLRHVPLLQRKEKLEDVLKKSRLDARVNYSEHVVGHGKEMIEKACGMDLEGIVSKKIDSTYDSRRDPTWIKSKCTSRQEFVIIGYTDPKGARRGFGSILLGYHDDKRRLVYGGRVGAGFDEKGLNQMIARFRDIEIENPPTDVPPPARERRNAHWVEPKLVAEVRFTSWTRDGVLRHPVFVALRTDKPGAQIVREKAMSVKKIKKHATAHAGNGQHKKSAKAEEEFEGVRLTHPDKVLFAEQGVTKRDIAAYYSAVQDWMLPFVVDRPLALVRCPEGTGAKCFFQRNWSETMPPAVGKVTVGEAKKKEQHVTIHDLSGVISLVQIGVLEIHTWNCATNDVDHPDQLIFDLDPGPDVSWKRVIDGAKKLNKMLGELKLPTFLKTSGGKGLHITIPIEPNIDWSAGKSFCQTIANAMVEQSGWFVANMRKNLRGGKIYIDYNRNDHFATAVAPYSTRNRPGAAVSMPITWEELGRIKSANQFTVENAAKYVARRKKNPWAKFERSRVDLRKFVKQTVAR